MLLRNKRKHSSSTSSSPVRTHKRKHHHSSKSERKKHKSREEKSFHKHKRKKHHKEQIQDPPNQADTPDVEFKAPHTRSAVMVVNRPTDPKVSLLAPDLESPVLPACVQNFSEPPAELSAVDVICSSQGTIGDDVIKSSDSKTLSNMINTLTTVESNTAMPTVKNTTSSESLEDDGIEEGEILEGTGTHTPTSNIESNDPSQRDSYKVARKLKRKPSHSIELAMEKPSNQKLKKRKWKKEKDISAKKHKIK